MSVKSGGVRCVNYDIQPFCAKGLWKARYIFTREMNIKKQLIEALRNVKLFMYLNCRMFDESPPLELVYMSG